MKETRIMTERYTNPPRHGIHRGNNARERESDAGLTPVPAARRVRASCTGGAGLRLVGMLVRITGAASVIKPWALAQRYGDLAASPMH